MNLRVIILFSRSNINHMNQLKDAIKTQVELASDQEKYLQEYKICLELLVEEKNTLVDSLRLIHDDINDMEKVIKIAEEAKKKGLNMANSLYSEYQPTKQGVIQSVSQQHIDYDTKNLDEDLIIPPG